MGLEVPLWRAVAAFRLASLGYAAVLIARNHGDYARPWVGWTVLAVMTAWTLGTGAVMLTGRAASWARAAPPRVPPLAADLAVATCCLLASRFAESADRIDMGARTLTVWWAAAPVFAWAVAGGRRWGVAAAAAIAAADLAVHAGHGHGVSESTFNSVVLLFMAGVITGYAAELTRSAGRRLAAAVELEAATRERERLARGIHDSVLQVLALVQRRGVEAGGAAAELGRLAGEQEAALRALVSGRGAAAAAGPPGLPAAPGAHAVPGVPGAPGAVAEREGTADLAELLAGYGSATVTVSLPATPVRLPAATAREMSAAVAAALDNVRRHCADGTRAWVFAEEEDGDVTVTVRDDGPGFAGDRLAEAAAEGRFGVSQSIRGRLRDLGGDAVVTSAPGAGTEVELRLPARVRR